VQGEGQGERVGVHHAASVETVVTQGESGGPAGQVPPGHGVGVQQRGRGGGTDLGDRLGQSLAGGGVDGQVDPDPEQAGLAAGQAFGEPVGVVRGHAGGGVGQSALVGVQASGGFEPGPGPFESRGRDRGREWVDVHGSIDSHV
jgi:hypothetical protein